MLVDTDVLIWYMRGNEKAYRQIEKINNLFISVVSYIELIQGLRNKSELNILRETIRDWEASILYISEDISTKAMFYVEQHYLSHSLKLADALIAATAVSNGLAIFTGNDKHYNLIRDLKVKKFQT